jgi:hypothetical protein
MIKIESRMVCIIVLIVIIVSIGTPRFTKGATQRCEIKEECSQDSTEKNGDISTSSQEYWGLLVAVGTYADSPNMDRPSMLIEVENLYSTLLKSSKWEEDHIRVITQNEATPQNILYGFRWLDEMEDENDICLIYFTTHGFPILFDIPPFDENDRMDEALATYTGFLPYENPWSWEPLANPFGILTDDLINFLLNRLEASGVCMIVDSCHSGGFNDIWKYGTGKQFDKSYTTYDIYKELQGMNRVVLTSVREEDLSYGSYFTHFLVEGMKGYADKNNDGTCSGEEIFHYAQPIVRDVYGLKSQIFDAYPGELPLT